MKVLDAMETHINTKRAVGEVHSGVKKLLTTFLKPRSDMKTHKLTEYEKKYLLKEPEPFQPDDVVDQDLETHFGHTIDSYRDYVEAEELEAKLKNDERHVAKRAKHPFLRMPDLMNCGLLRCSGCGKQMIYCHDVLYGLYCTYKVISYIQDEVEIVDEVVVKKIFIDTYNRCLAFDTFRKFGKAHKEWVFPPPCVQDNSYNYCIFWYEWMVEDKWQMHEL